MDLDALLWLMISHVPNRDLHQWLLGVAAEVVHMNFNE